MPSTIRSKSVMSSRNMLCCLLGLAHLAAALPNLLDRRSTPAAAPPARIDIPLLFDSSGRYIIPVGMSPGPHVQNFNFTLATSTGLTSVAGTGCSSCSGVSLYNQSASTSAKSLDLSDEVSLVSGAFSGTVIKENCDMKTSNGSSWNYPNQTIVVANQQNSSSVFAHGVSGIIGLGTNRISTPTTGNNFTAGFNDTIFGEWLQRNLDQDAFQFGMSLNPPVLTPTSASSQAVASPTSTSAGTLHWLQPDSSAYNTQQIVYKNVENNSSVTYASGSQPDWSVVLDGWEFQGTDTIETQQEFMASVDPYYTDIYFPMQQAQIINAAISGSSLQTGLSSLGTQSEAWTVPCDAEFSLTVIIGSQKFTLDQSALVINLGNNVCVSGIEAWTDTSIDEYLLGALFIQKFYLVFSISRNGTDTVGFAPRAVVSKGSKRGAIIGGTVGGVVGVFLLGLAAFFFIRSRHDRAELKHTIAEVEEHKAANAVEPFPLGLPVTPQSGQSFAAQQAYGTPHGSPDVGAPLLPVHHDDIAPPTYEETETLRSEIAAPSVIGIARTSKGEYVLPASVQEGSSGSGEPPLTPNHGLGMFNIEE